MFFLRIILTTPNNIFLINEFRKLKADLTSYFRNYIENCRFNIILRTVRSNLTVLSPWAKASFNSPLPTPKALQIYHIVTKFP